MPRTALAWDGIAAGAQHRVLDASLVGIDISGFTALSERLAERGKLGAEELIRLIGATYAGLIDIAERNGGDVLKFRGDALLMLFEGAGHEARAAGASLAMQRFVRETGHTESSVGAVTLGMAAGVVSGPTHLFLVGSRRRELFVCGRAATETLRLEDAAESGEILVSARTAEALTAGVVGPGRDGAFLLRPEAAIDVAAPTARRDDHPVDPSPFIPPSLRSAAESGAVEAEHRRVTAAFLKFRGGDELAESGAAGAASLAALAELVTEVTDELGITWLESDIDRDGGKIYLVAGAPAAAGDEEERMLRALRAIVDRNAGPPIGVGVNRGPVLTGPIGSWARRTYAVMGDTVNLAARLAARAEVGEILATGEVLQRAQTRYATTPRQFLMKGKSKPVTGHAVGAAGGVDNAADRPPLPLVGRDEELATLRAAVDSARLRKSRAVELVGEAGAGKSRLLDELLGEVAGFQVLRAQCDAYAASTPFAPLRDLLRPLIGALPDEPAGPVGAKLSSFVNAALPDLAPWTPLLALAFDASVESTREVDEIDPAFRRNRLADVLDQLLSRLLLMPTILVVEDTHWLDDASQLVLTQLGRDAVRPWLVLLTRRSAGPQLFDDDAVVELGPLSDEAARALVLAAAGDAVISEEQLAAVTERAAGNPLFVRELATAPLGDADALPESVELLLTARIDTLDPADRLLLRHASVIGSAFDHELLAQILPDEAEGADVWDRLAEFVETDGSSTIRFRHELVRAAAYDGLSFERRREIHFAVAAALERRDGAAASPDVLSLHYLAAGVYEPAWRYAVAAGDAARAKYANVDAATFYRRALAAAGAFDPDPAELVRVSEALGDVLELAAHYDDADAAYARALELGGPPARLLRKRGVVCERRARYPEALTLFQQAAAAGDDAETVAAELGRATVLYRQGQIDESAHWAGLAADHATAIGDRERLADAYYVRAAAEGDRGGPAQQFLDRALAIFEEIGLLHRQATVLNNMGVRAYYEGDWDAAFTLYLRAEDAVRRAGDVLTGAHTLNNRAEILLDQGRLSDAGSAFEEALRRYRAASFPIGEALVTINLGRVAAADGRFDEAHERFAEAAGQLGALGSESFLLEAQARQAEAYVLEGRFDEARALAEAALAGTARTGEVGVRSALLERVLGLAAVQARRPADAAAHLGRSLTLARELHADYEIARTLRAAVDCGLGAEGDAAEATRLYDRLGIVATPAVPLP